MDICLEVVLAHVASCCSLPFVLRVCKTATWHRSHSFFNDLSIADAITLILISVDILRCLKILFYMAIHPD